MPCLQPSPIIPEGPMMKGPATDRRCIFYLTKPYANCLPSLFHPGSKTSNEILDKLSLACTPTSRHSHTENLLVFETIQHPSTGSLRTTAAITPVLCNLDRYSPIHQQDLWGFSTHCGNNKSHKFHHRSLSRTLPKTFCRASL